MTPWAMLESSQAERRDVRHDDAVRRSLMVLAGTFVGSRGALAIPTTASSLPTVRTVAGSGGSGSLSSPTGIAVDAAGDLFVADTNHCRVMLVPSRTGTLYGLQVAAHHAYSLVGGGCGGKASLGFPTGVAVNHAGDVYIAEATDQRILMIRPGSHAVATVAGTGSAGYNGNGLAALSSKLNYPTGIAVDAKGDLYIADTANCRVRVMPAADGTSFGQPMLTQHLYSIAGNGVCGSGQRSGSAALAQLWNPVAVVTDQVGDVFIADSGDQSILELPVKSGSDYGTSIAAGGIAAIVGEGGNGPYLADGLSALSQTAELNDPEGIAVSADRNALHHRRQSALHQGGAELHLHGAWPLDAGRGPLHPGRGAPGLQLDRPGKWNPLDTHAHIGDPTGITVSTSGTVLYSDRSTQLVREIG